jgi:hypothetical protein
VALATVADERSVAAYSGRTGAIDALRGGIYIVAANQVRFLAARVVADAPANATLGIGPRATHASLRLSGPGVRVRNSPCTPRRERSASPARWDVAT